MKPSEIAKLTKEEILFLASHTCKHGHKYLSHYECYKREVGNIAEERVGILDIESTGLDADFGFILSYAIKVHGVPVVLGRAVTEKEVRDGTYDAKICAELVRDLKRFDRIVGYYIKDRRFDMPYIRSRCLYNGVDFPAYGELKITDVYDIVKNKMKLGRSRLASACQFLGIGAKTHPLTGKVWQDARTGKAEALKYVWQHNVEDVNSTDELWTRIKKFVRSQKTSV